MYIFLLSYDNKNIRQYCKADIEGSNNAVDLLRIPSAIAN